MTNLLETFEILEKIRASGRNTLFRARDRRDNRTVILKMMAGNLTNREDRARFRREFDLLERLAGTPGVIGVREFIEAPEGDTIVLEYFECQTLAAFTQGKPLDFAGLLAMTIDIVTTLDRIHKKGLIHKDLSPNNILIHPETRELRLIDFGLSAEVSRETHEGFAAVLSGTPAYLSPEQTGRAHRRLDYRSDYYSLGMVLYFLTTGSPAFDTADIVEMIYCHLAKMPPPPRGLAPRAWGDMVLKLVAKSPDDRYQSLAGFLADLDQCQQKWEASGEAAPFPLGTQDALDRFTLPQRLYGRELEVRHLREAFERAVQGQRELIFVTGFSGIGKTALVQELYTPLTAARAYFLRGKFDQHQRDLPYLAIRLAVEDLLHQVLAGPSDWITRTRQALLEALQSSASVIAALVPGFQDLVGELPPPPELNPKETESRLFLAFSSLIRTLATQERPAVLFIDDVQWADPASVRLLEHLCFTGDIRHLLAVFSYRDTEMLDSTPFWPFLDRSRAAKGVSAIHLGPLDELTVSQVVADALRCPAEQARSLGTLVATRTKGNPFFIGQFLTACHREGLISFHLPSKSWSWDQRAITALGSGDDVIQFLIASINRLPTQAATCLKIAACLGSTFDLDGFEPFAAQFDSVEDSLLTLVDQDYLVPVEGDTSLLKYADAAGLTPRFRFQHDRIRQAAYELWDEDGRHRTHLALGRDRLARTPTAELPRVVIDIVSHFNQARSLLTAPEDLLLLVRLNHQAALRARASSMFDLAFRLASVAKDLMQDPAVAASSGIRDEVLLNFVAAAYTVHQVDAAEEACTRLLGVLTDPRERAEVLRLQADFYNFLDRMADSLAKSRDALLELGINLPLQPSDEELYAQIVAIGALATTKTPEQILGEEAVTDRTLLTALAILAGIIVPAYMSGSQNLFALASLTAAKISLENGPSAESAIAFGNYSILLASMGQYEAAMTFSNLGIGLNDRFQDAKWKAFIHSSNTLYCMPWVRPWAEFVEHSRQTIDYGFQTGDLFIMAYHCSFVVPWNESLTLAMAIQTQERYLDIIRETGQEGAWVCSKFQIQKWKALAGRFRMQGSLDDPGFDCGPTVQAMATQQNYSALARFHLYSGETQWFFAYPAEALASFRQLEPMIAALAGSAFMVEYSLFGFLVHAANLKTATAEDRPALLDRMARERDRMKGWAQANPGNFAALGAFLEAEWARFDGQDVGARVLFRSALDLVDKTANLGHRALIHEEAAAFHQEQGDGRYAGYLLQEAWRLYGLWGALGKQSQLEALHSDRLFVSHGATADRKMLESSDTSRTLDIDIDSLVDTASLIKATQAISREIDIQALYRRIIPIALENAGAQGAWLVLTTSGAPVTAAWGTADGVFMGTDPGSEPPPIPLPFHHSLMEGKFVLTDDAIHDPACQADPVVAARRVRSALGVPLESPQGRIGYWYLENTLLEGAFTPVKKETLRILATQVAISLENARMYQDLDELNHTLEQRVVQRTEELAEKNRQMVNSIEYAALLQRAILPAESDMKRSLRDHAVLWKPRDLVSGDLYWFRQTEGGFLLAIIDCTGHGVPGAFMTMAAHTNLNRAMAEDRSGDPAKMLTRLHQLTRATLGQDRNNAESDDGLDIGLCSWNRDTDTLSFAGARIDLLIQDGDEIRAERGERISLGYRSDAANIEFITHKITPARNLRFFLTTDGFLSQLGGALERAYGKERFCQLVSNTRSPLSGEEAQWDAALKEYRGACEQMDDVTVIGFKTGEE